ncbi:hypothetical protein HAX54_011356, partial [Datura stramonium]|nr:hypothetical protein [Datura stramonium]
PLESCPNQKIDKLKGDLAGVTTIRRDLAEAKKDDAASKEINEVVESYAGGDTTRIDDDLYSCGGEYTPLDIGGAGGKYTPLLRKFDVKKILHTCWIEALTEAQGMTEASINKLISKRDIYSSSRISKPFTIVGVGPYPGGVPWLGPKEYSL